MKNAFDLHRKTQEHVSISRAKFQDILKTSTSGACGVGEGRKNKTRATARSSSSSSSSRKTTTNATSKPKVKKDRRTVLPRLDEDHPQQDEHSSMSSPRTTTTRHRTKSTSAKGVVSSPSTTRLTAVVVGREDVASSYTTAPRWNIRMKPPTSTRTKKDISRAPAGAGPRVTRSSRGPTQQQHSSSTGLLFGRNLSPKSYLSPKSSTTWSAPPSPSVTHQMVFEGRRLARDLSPASKDQHHNLTSTSSGSGFLQQGSRQPKNMTIFSCSPQKPDTGTWKMSCPKNNVASCRSRLLQQQSDSEVSPPEQERAALVGASSSTTLLAGAPAVLVGTSASPGNPEAVDENTGRGRGAPASRNGVESIGGAGPPHQQDVGGTESSQQSHTQRSLVCSTKQRRGRTLLEVQGEDSWYDRAISKPVRPRRSKEEATAFFEALVARGQETEKKVNKKREEMTMAMAMQRRERSPPSPSPGALGSRSDIKCKNINNAAEHTTKGQEAASSTKIKKGSGATETRTPGKTVKKNDTCSHTASEEPSQNSNGPSTRPRVENVETGGAVPVGNTEDVPELHQGGLGSRDATRSRSSEESVVILHCKEKAVIEDLVQQHGGKNYVDEEVLVEERTSSADEDLFVDESSHDIKSYRSSTSPREQLVVDQERQQQGQAQFPSTSSTAGTKNTMLETTAGASTRPRPKRTRTSASSFASSSSYSSSSSSKHRKKKIVEVKNGNKNYKDTVPTRPFNDQDDELANAVSAIESSDHRPSSSTPRGQSRNDFAPEEQAVLDSIDEAFRVMAERSKGLAADHGGVSTSSSASAMHEVKKRTSTTDLEAEYIRRSSVLSR
ncbi:unnamed protein product [Amoebophrya sp. A25]|nr:unnamed protein product [Amoebophrya sp. A25]|eukprot:GSA25T00019278001.1